MSRTLSKWAILIVVSVLGVLGTGCPPGGDSCARVNCDDNDPCTADQCFVGQCMHTELDCRPLCDPLCDDGDPCTLDDCVEGECTYVPRECPLGTACDGTSGACVELGEDVSIAATWGSSTGDMHVDIDWQLPSGEWVPIQRGGWGRSGAESASMPKEDVPDGLHYLVFQQFGEGQSADVVYRVDFLGYHFEFENRLTAYNAHNIGIAVQGGIPKAIFNDWLPESAATSGFHPVEFVAGWQNSQQHMHLDVDIWNPRSERLHIPHRQGWASQGFEYAIVPSGTVLDGTYEVGTSLFGGGSFTDVSLALVFPEVTFKHNARYPGNIWRTIGVDVTDGQGCVFFNGWMPAGDPQAGGGCGRPLEVTAGWRDAVNDMHVDIEARIPSGEEIPVWRSGWAEQGFERAYLPAGTSIQNGTYVFEFKLFGGGTWSDIVYNAALLDWSFQAARRELGGASFTVTVEVSGSHATEVANTWPAD